jgi:hypothetical protein
MNKKNMVKLILFAGFFIIFFIGSDFSVRLVLSQCEPPPPYTGEIKLSDTTFTPATDGLLGASNKYYDLAKDAAELNIKKGFTENHDIRMTYDPSTDMWTAEIGTWAGLPSGDDGDDGGGGGGNGGTSCGNGAVESGEQCDPPGQTIGCTVGGQAGTQTCNSNCQWGDCIVIVQCGNGVCEQGETQENCCLDDPAKRDCCTYVSIKPSAYLLPNQNVVLSIWFWDSGYTAGKKVNFAVFIDGTKEWLEPDCISAMNITPPAGGCTSCGCSKIGMEWNCASGEKMNVTSSSKYFKVDVECKVPVDITAGSHTLSATPAFYSKEVKLKSAETVMSVKENDKDLILMVIRFFSQLIEKFKSRT